MSKLVYEIQEHSVFNFMHAVIELDCRLWTKYSEAKPRYVDFKELHDLIMSYFSGTMDVK